MKIPGSDYTWPIVQLCLSLALRIYGLRSFFAAYYWYFRYDLNDYLMQEFVAFYDILGFKVEQINVFTL